VSKNTVIAFVLGIVILIGGFLFLQNQSGKQQKSDQSGMVEEKQEVTGSDKATQNQSGYVGNVIAGEISPYLDFKKQDYEKAIRDGKIVFLNFYANWCPICRAEAPDINEGFNSLTTDKIVGFRVNYNDSETDEDEKILAKQFGVTYQHTKVILRDGKQVLKVIEQWDKDKLISELEKAAK